MTDNKELLKTSQKGGNITVETQPNLEEVNKEVKPNEQVNLSNEEPNKELNEENNKENNGELNKKDFTELDYESLNSNEEDLPNNENNNPNPNHNNNNNQKKQINPNQEAQLKLLKEIDNETINKNPTSLNKQETPTNKLPNINKSQTTQEISPLILGGKTDKETTEQKPKFNINSKLYSVGNDETKTLTQLIDDNIINNPLIRKNIIVEKVKEYVYNIGSDIYNEYTSTMHNFYKKINKNTYIEIKDDVIYLYKVGEKKYISKVKKAKYINFKQRLDELETEITNKKINLENLYDKLLILQNRTTENIKYFEKEKQRYIELLEEQEIYRLYDIIINNKLTQNYTSITYPSLYLLNDVNYIIENQMYYVDNNIIDKLNDFQSIKLDEYNNIIKMLKEKKTLTADDKNIILQYLKTKENKEVLAKINEAKYKQNNYVDYIVRDLPEI